MSGNVRKCPEMSGTVRNVRNLSGTCPPVGLPSAVFPITARRPRLRALTSPEKCRKVRGPTFSQSPRACWRPLLPSARYIYLTVCRRHRERERERGRQRERERESEREKQKSKHRRARCSSFPASMWWPVLIWFRSRSPALSWPFQQRMLQAWRFCAGAPGRGLWPGLRRFCAMAADLLLPRSPARGCKPSAQSALLGSRAKAPDGLQPRGHQAVEVELERLHRALFEKLRAMGLGLSPVAGLHEALEHVPHAFPRVAGCGCPHVACQGRSPRH